MTKPSEPGHPALRRPVRFLQFDLSEGSDGVVTIEAVAATRETQHPAVLAEVHQVLDWAWQHFGHSHGMVEEGADWDHDLQAHIEAGCWHSVHLTVAASPRFSAAFEAAFLHSCD